MLVEKNGISRVIDEARLAEFREKGYAPVEQKKRPPEKKPKDGA